jgi:hypothetical protein
MEDGRREELSTSVMPSEPRYLVSSCSHQNKKKDKTNGNQLLPDPTVKFFPKCDDASKR